MKLIILIIFLSFCYAQPENPVVKTSIQELDSSVMQILWCGASVVFTKDDETIEQKHKETRKVVYVLTEKGNIWRSIDYGLSWINETPQFERLLSKSSSSYDTIFFESMQISPADSRVIYLFGSKDISIRSRDCGRTYDSFDHDDGLYDFKLNKMDDKWIMAFKDKPCGKLDQNCKEFYKKSIYVTRDGGKTWKSVLNYVREASWDKLLQYQMVPDERIIVCHMKEGKSVVSYSDDYFQTTNVMRENAQGYFQTSYYLFVLGKPDPINEGFELLISPAYLDKFMPQEIKLPIDNLEQHSFTILDTSEGQIFISVSHKEENQKLTNIYVSDFRGWKFSLSLLHNVRSLDNGNCDFERILGMEGVYIANIYDHSEVEKQRGKEQQKRLEQYKKTYISYDKGGNWHTLKAPEVDCDGQTIICSGDCTLHLKGRTEQNQNPIYSSENSPGIAIGVGNTGLYLSENDQDLNTYFTRDGGHEWFEILKGSYMYEIGDRGGLLVMARDDQPTTSVVYSWNEGLTWEIIQVSEKPFFVRNIVTEPSNMEQKFIIYGETGVSENKFTGFLIGLNFQTLHQRVCSGSWDPTMPESDYEFWIPKNFENGKCLFGRKMKYIRRKREATCFNQEEMDKKFYVDSCPCVNDDWECDFGFYRRMEGGPCIPIADEFDDEQPDVIKPPKDCQGTYMKSQGYRKVSGDYCQGGVDLSPQPVACPNPEKNETILIQNNQNEEKENKPTKETNQTQEKSNVLWLVAIILSGILFILILKDKIIPRLLKYKTKLPAKNNGNRTQLQRKSYEQLSLFQNEDDEA